MKTRALVALGIGATFTFLVPFANAAELLSIEPIIGYERSQKLVPTPHTKDRLIYGARATAGLRLLSLELEYTRGTDSEDFPSDGLASKDTDDRLKMGLVSSFGLGRLFRLHARGGVQASKNIHEETQAGVTTVTSNPIEYNPYAGAGLSAGLGRKLSISGSLTAVFREFPDMSKNEYQATLGFSIKLP